MASLRIFLYLLGCLCLLHSCSGQPRNERELLDYLFNPKNEFKKRVTIDDIQVDLTYYPNTLLNKKLGRDTIDFETKPIYFLLSLSYTGKGLLSQVDKQQYNAFMQRIAFDLSHYIKLIHAGRSFQPADAYFAPTYGLSSSDDILLVFDQLPLPHSGKILIQMEEIGLALGVQEFSFDMEKLSKIEKIKLKPQSKS